MLITILLLLFGLPIIAALAALAWKRARRLTERIQAVQEEMARDPRPPYAALAELLQEPQDKEK